MKKKYFYLVAFFIAAFTIDSLTQDVYVDINPDDIMYANDNNYLIDMDADGTDDFELHFWFDDFFYDSEIWIKGLNGNEVYFEPDEEHTGVVDVLDTISSNMDWDTTSFLIKTHPWGNWWDVEDKYIGVRMTSSGGYFYGWIRIDGPGTYNSGNRLIFKDYGYNPVLNQFIIAGLPVYYKVDNAEVTDIDNNRDGTDLLVTFEKALGDDEILEYRLMAVKAENAEVFTLEQALLLSADRYLAMQPSGQDIYKQSFEETSVDVDGDLIADLQPYKIFILTYINLPDYEGLLSNASQEIMLITPAEAVENIDAEDIADYGDGRDLRVTFDKIADETTIAEYRIFVVDYSDADSFDRDEADGLTGEYYTAISPSGQNIEIVLNETSQTVEGLPIGSGGYNIFVMAMTDSIQTDYSGFSRMNEITGLVQPSDNMILAGKVREEAIFTDSLISVAGIFPEGGESQNIDFNNDGIDDAVLSAYSWSSMAGSGGSASISSLNDTKLVKLPLDFNTPINKDLTWAFSSGETSCSTIINSTSCSGEWVGAGSKYLGIFIINNNDTIFGWAKLHSNSNGGGYISIDGWAYINVTSLPVEENQIEDVNIFPNPAKDFILIEFGSVESKDINIEIFDDIGRIVASKRVTSTNEPIEINISNFDKGIYFIKISSKEQRLTTRKLIVW